jgi:folate-dependent phosphoribosylglycinamide formyltransferase PurN
MKIACLIAKAPPTIYYVNQIHERHPISLVIVEKSVLVERRQTPMQQLMSTYRKYGVLETVLAVSDELLRRSNRQSLDKVHQEYFKTDWYEINREIPVVYVDDINASEVPGCLKAIQPDIILDHGTSILKKPVIESADLALNLHWGLSPYYRGTHCTEWALINWDPYNIGVTMHRLSRKIDGGDIAAQKRAIITPDDTAHSINMQLSVLGTDLACKILHKMANGEMLAFEKQQTGLGFLTLDRQWSRYCRKHIQYIERNGIIARMLKNPVRSLRLPIVELPGDKTEDNAG